MPTEQRERAIVTIYEELEGGRKNWSAPENLWRRSA